MIMGECADLYIKSMLWVHIRMVPIFIKRNVGNDQDNVQSERNFQSKMPNIIIN